MMRPCQVCRISKGQPRNWRIGDTQLCGMFPWVRLTPDPASTEPPAPADPIPDVHRVHCRPCAVHATRSRATFSPGLPNPVRRTPNVVSLMTNLSLAGMVGDIFISGTDWQEAGTSWHRAPVNSFSLPPDEQFSLGAEQT